VSGKRPPVRAEGYRRGQGIIATNCLATARTTPSSNANLRLYPCLSLCKWATASRIDAAMEAINQGAGLNAALDLRVRAMQGCSETVWSTMQTIAEQKCKSYTCVVVCVTNPPVGTPCSSRIGQASVPGAVAGLAVNPPGFTPSPFHVTDAQLDLLGARGKLDRDPDGEPCLAVSQRTPLRVLHRRTLLTRPKVTHAPTFTPTRTHNDIHVHMHTYSPNVTSLSNRVDPLRLPTIHRAWIQSSSTTSEPNVWPATVS